MKKFNNIIFNDNISKSYLKYKKLKKNNLFLKNALNEIYKNLNKKKDVFHSLSSSFKLGFNKNQLSKYKRFKKVAIVGMGGSALGVKAIYSFLESKIKKEFFFFDNLDEVQIKVIKKRKILKNALFIIISKSGNTIETLINSDLLFGMKLNSSNTILITERRNNFLNTFSKRKNIPIIAHKTYIGGRYSVLSEVGMLPAYLMGLKINNLRKNLLKSFEDKRKNLIIENILKNFQFHSSKKINSMIFFNYCPQLNDFAYWCQQLIAESLGKNGKGILPVVSPAPKDHHSLLQLYLDGPKDKVFYVISSKGSYNTKSSKNFFKKSFKFLKNKKLNKIILSKKEAFLSVLKRKKIPFREIQIKNFSEETIGELFSYFMIETVMTGLLMNINPFNQPAVEEVKVLTKKNLS